MKEFIEALLDRETVENDPVLMRLDYLIRGSLSSYKRSKEIFIEYLRRHYNYENFAFDGNGFLKLRSMYLNNLNESGYYLKLQSETETLASPGIGKSTYGRYINSMEPAKSVLDADLFYFHLWNMLCSVESPEKYEINLIYRSSSYENMIDRNVFDTVILVYVVRKIEENIYKIVLDNSLQRVRHDKIIFDKLYFNSSVGGGPEHFTETKRQAQNLTDLYNPKYEYPDDF